MCTLLARVGRRRVCVHFDGATMATWVTDAVGHGGVKPFVVLDGDANTPTVSGRHRLLVVVRERGGKPCFGWAPPPSEYGVWKGIRMGHVEITQGSTLEKGSYDHRSFHAVHNTICMLTFATPFAIVNCTLIAQFDNYGTAYHREKQQ